MSGYRLPAPAGAWIDRTRRLGFSFDGRALQGHAGDTLASHSGWAELVPGTDYTGNRKAAVFGTATTADPSVISNSASPASFAMLVNGTTVAGALLCNAASGTSGVLFSVGNFTGGDKSVDNGDTLNVTYTFSLDAA